MEILLLRLSEAERERKHIARSVFLPSDALHPAVMDTDGIQGTAIEDRLRDDARRKNVVLNSGAVSPTAVWLRLTDSQEVRSDLKRRGGGLGSPAFLGLDGFHG